jgi:hypothetical protein
MIHYALLCEHDHEFDSWFDSSKAYDKLQKSGLVECPHCGSTHIRKALMTPQIGTMRANKTKDSPASAPADCDEPALQKAREQAIDLARKLRDHVKENAEDVGDEFAKEARKIHGAVPDN